MVAIKIYVEGGGTTKILRTKCRKGFSTFFRKAGFEGRMPRIIASGSRNEAYDDFCTAVRHAQAHDFPVLVVDSEASVSAADSVWEHLRKQDGWNQPDKATDDQAFLMVQCMEAWFIADLDCISGFYGQYFNGNALPARPDVEEIRKDTLLLGLVNATRRCQKGKYSKGNHSFEILECVDPDRVRAVSLQAKRMLETLSQVTTQ